MTLSEDLSWRGLIKDKTFDNASWLDQPRRFYLGIDVVSADSLTIGNLAILLLAKRLRASGWQAVMLVGGGTSLVGDPGGKTEERQLKSREEIAQNVKKIEAQIQQLFAGEDFQMVDNYDWLNDLNYLTFLRDIGKYYSVTELTQRDFITARLGEGGSGISYAEFSYTLIQGYDFWHLFKEDGVVMQIGGSDQWGNLLSGVQLIRKKENKEAHALSMPLVVNKLTGKKFGKSEEGAVWLDPAQTTPTQFYQFWINVEDENAEDYLKVYTFLSKEGVERTVSEHRQSPEKRQAQRRLAEEVTKLVHGEENMRAAQAVTEYLTGLTPIGEASEGELAQLRKEIRSVSAKVGDEIAEVLARSELVPSKSEGRRVRAGGGVYINGQAITAEHLEQAHFQNGKALLRRGKRMQDSALVELA